VAGQCKTIKTLFEKSRKMFDFRRGHTTHPTINLISCLQLLLTPENKNKKKEKRKKNIRKNFKANKNIESFALTSKEHAKKCGFLKTRTAAKPFKRRKKYF
jgi:hypothetical protein